MSLRHDVTLKTVESILRTQMTAKQKTIRVCNALILHVQGLELEDGNLH